MTEQAKRPHTLADAVRAVSGTAGQDSDAVLEEMRRQTEALLGCDAAAIHRAENTPDGPVFRRMHASDVAAAQGAAGSPPWRPTAALLEALARGRAVFYEDFQSALAGDVEPRPWLRDLGSALYAPLISADGLFGLLFAGWFERRSPTGEMVATAEALGCCAAIAIRTSRLLEEAGRWRRLLGAAEERQRREIAEMLHGGVQTRLLVAWHQLGRALDTMQADPAAARALVEQVRNDIDHVREHDVRRASHLLHPHVIRVGLVAGIQSLVRRVGDYLDVSLVASDALRDLDAPVDNRIPESVRLTTYRVVEEALNNVVRHAAAHTVRIDLGVEEQALVLSVRDDGAGFDDHAVTRGLGLNTITARIIQSGGACDVSSAPGQGTTIAARLPLAEHADGAA